ncbi:DUF2934 domain-containing protein [Palleronia sp.]|uniref:DUF2934 domain-containing protein n=1 Tax=Palleronia sp. TaxID=1940284 RepID=UPI0035C84ADF
MDQDREQRISTRAYEIWEREGRQEGGHEAHWQQAERELRDEDHPERGENDASSPTPGGRAVPAGPAGGTKPAKAPRKKKEPAVNSKGKK